MRNKMFGSLLALLVAAGAFGQGIEGGGSTGGGSGSVTSVATGSCLSGGPITTTGTVAFNGAINPQTTTYQVLAADFTGCKTITVASGTFTITLVASGSQPPAGQYIDILNYGSGVITVAPSGQNINGSGSSWTLGAGSASAPSSMRIRSDATNYFATGGSAFPATTCTNQFIYVLAAGTAAGTCRAIVNADITNGTIDLTTKVTGILPTANGGIANAFFTVAGPASSAKTYTFPNANATVPQTIASGSLALATSAISSGACQTVSAGVNNATATGTLTTDAISFTPNGSIKAVTGYVPSTSGGLTINAYPTADNVNFDVCNWESGSVTPGAVTVNWRVIR